MGLWSNTQPVCASCRYWTGQRKIDFTATFFDVKEEQGTCQGPLGSYRGLTTWEGGGCSQWKTFREES